jgi:hypothetical protein
MNPQLYNLLIQRTLSFTMARTNQTARKSIGGAAPRRQLAGSSSQPPLYYNYGKRPSQNQIVSENPVIPDIVSIPREAISLAATKSVLSTPDLLVIILSQLPHSSLLKAKRVNRTWASLCGHIEIQAALFQHPRPKGSALYVETHSDILMDKFSTFWPINREDKAVFSKSSTAKTFHPRSGTKYLSMHQIVMIHQNHICKTQQFFNRSSNEDMETNAPMGSSGDNFSFANHLSKL